MAASTPPARASSLFAIMALLAMVVNFLCAYINYVVWAPEAVNPTLRNLIVDFGLVWIILGVVVTVFAYFTSLRPGVARPRVLLYLMWFSLACGIAGYFLGALGVTWDNFPAFIGAAVVCALIPIIPAWLERLAGTALGKSASALIDSGRAGAGLRCQHLASVLLPNQRGEHRRLGIALNSLGRTDEALVHLEQAEADGAADAEVYSALSDIYTTARRQDKAIEATSKLYHIRQQPATLKRLVNLYLESGRREDAVDAITSLPEEDQRQWLDQLAELLLQLRRVDEARAVATRLEADGAPFSRARALLHRIVDQNPRYAAALEQYLALSRRVNDWKAVGQALESLVAMAPGNTDRRRELIQHLRFQDDHESVIHHLEVLIQNGAATQGETLEVLKHWDKLGENRRVERMIAENDSLARSAEAVTLLAASLVEQGRFDEAEVKIRIGRSLEHDAAVSATLQSLESKIQRHRLEHDLDSLAEKVKAEPENMDLRFEYLDRMAGAGKADRVVVELDAILDKQPDLFNRVMAEVARFQEHHGYSGRLMRYVADLRFEREEWDGVFDAIREMAKHAVDPDRILREGCESILEKNPAHLPSHETLARVLADQGEARRALVHIDRCAEITDRPVEGPLLDIDYRCSIHAEQHERARRAGLRLLEQRPTDATLLLQIADLDAKAGRFDEAVELVQRAQEAAPDNHTLPAVIKQYSEQKKRARIAAIHESLGQDSKNAALLEELGDLHHDFNQFNDAIVAYQRATQADPNASVARGKLGYVLTRKEMYADASDVFAEVPLKIEQSAAEQDRLKALFFAAAEVMEEDKQFEGALGLYKRIFRVDAGYRDVVPRIERLDRIAKQKQKR